MDWNNKEEVLDKVFYRPSTLEYAPYKIRNNKEIVLEAVRTYGGALKYAGNKMWIFNGWQVYKF